MHTGQNSLTTDLVQVLTEVVGEHDFTRFFERAAGAAAELIGGDGAALITLDNRDTLCYRFFLGLPAELEEPLRRNCFPAERGTAGLALHTMRSVYNPDYPASPNAMPEYVAAGLKSNLLVPVSSGNEVLGVLAISWFHHHGPPAIQQDAIRVAELLANMIGAAFHRQQLSNELRRQAYEDTLTGLGNRMMLTERLEHAIASAQRDERLIAVLVLDIDGFKRINDRMGHAAGDRLLQEVASRLGDVVRRNDTVVRLGGDEFVILVECARSLSEIQNVIRRIIIALQIRITINGRTEQVSTSLGATVYPLDDVSPDVLIAHADNAMYVSKTRGGNAFSYFDRHLEEKQNDIEKREQDLRRGLAADEFVLFYQPIVDSHHGEILAFEALIRWQHPEHGLLTPGEFIPLAEQSNLIQDIDNWMMEKAVHQLADWHAEGHTFSISVNVSARQFESPNFTDKLRTLMARYPGADPKCLKLEIVESLAISDLDHASRVIDECRLLGVQCALDDFGTGYASIAYLRKLSVMTLKIDRSFIDAMNEVKKDLVLVHSLVGLASIFELECIAEGVENLGQLLALHEVGCYKVQGHLIARPMPLSQLPRWIENWPQQLADLHRPHLRETRGVGSRL